ncbi:MAG: hypothetical protein ACLR6B_00795 [Blautia sp.]
MRLFGSRRILKELTGKSYGGVWLKHSVAKEGLRAAWHQLKSWEKEIFYEEKGSLRPIQESFREPRESEEKRIFRN